MRTILRGWLLPGVLCVALLACQSSTVSSEEPVPAASPRPALVPDPADAASPERLQGFGAQTKGGAGGRVITISEASTEAVRAAFSDARTGNVVIRFAVTEPIRLDKMIPHLTGSNVTIEGNGATIDGSGLQEEVALLDVRAHDVIVRDLRLRNGYDNLRVQGPEAHDVVIDHVSSTGARDDGIAIGYGAHDVTVQWCLLAGNTRGLFSKYDGTRNLSIHHTWIQKSWARSPLISGATAVDVRNVIVEDWTLWGARFEDGASGNVVGSLFMLSPHAVGLGGKPAAALRLKKSGPVYLADNVFRGAVASTRDGTAPAPLPAPDVTTLPVAEMEPLVRAGAGCQPRDRVDAAYVALRQGWRVGEHDPLRVGLR